jgi:hypothetical protein
MQMQTSCSITSLEEEKCPPTVDQQDRIYNPVITFISKDNLSLQVNKLQCDISTTVANTLAAVYIGTYYIFFFVSIFLYDREWNMMVG